MKKNILFFLVLMLFGPGYSFAQDQHFTQFYASPLTLNPALTGAFEGKYRFSFIYRDQWRKVLENPYVTYSGSADFRFRLSSYQKKYKDAVGAGVVFYSDKVTVTGFSTNQMVLSGAFHKSLSRSNDQFLSLGAQVGIAQRNVNYDSFTFDDQFNGSNGYTNTTAENLPENNFAFGDYNIGLNYSYSPARKLGVFAGVALHHILEPNLSFFYEADNPDKFPQNKLHQKITGNVSLLIPVGQTIQLSPRALFYQQGPHTALNVGSNIRFLVNDINGTAIHLGSWLRSSQDQDNAPIMDAVIALVGIEYGNFLIGFSYDATLNDLSISRRNQGAFELSVAYLGQYENETVICPKF